MGSLKALCPGALAVPMLTTLEFTPRSEITLDGSGGSSSTADETLSIHSPITDQIIPDTIDALMFQHFYINMKTFAEQLA